MKSEGQGPLSLRVAISGSAGTGKTTLARELSRRLGLPLIPEAMRAYLEAGGARWDQRSRAEGARELARFRRTLAEEERRLGSFIADNGALDLEAYARWYQCGPAEDPATWPGRYDAVVLLPAGVLPYVRDGVRREDAAEEARFQVLLEAVADAGPWAGGVLRVPRDLLTVPERAAWVASGLGLLGAVPK